jgi:hypothetical protein
MAARDYQVAHWLLATDIRCSYVAAMIFAVVVDGLVADGFVAGGFQWGDATDVGDKSLICRFIAIVCAVAPRPFDPVEILALVLNPTGRQGATPEIALRVAVLSLSCPQELLSRRTAAQPTSSTMPSKKLAARPTPGCESCGCISSSTLTIRGGQDRAVGRGDLIAARPSIP